MRTLYRLFLAALFLAALPEAHAQSYADRVYGRITTDDGEVFEGLIRWDKNEVSWVDLLDGSRTVERERRGRRGSVSVFGLEINYDDDGNSTSRSSGLRLGHVRTLEPDGRNSALLTLKSGETVVLTGGSTDLGTDIREIVVEDRRRGRVELDWDDLERVEFMQARDVRDSRLGERLHGTLTTRDGNTFTGYVCWDVDEVLTEDVLDGEDRRGRDYEVPFAEIAEIHREDSRSARVMLHDGEELILGGTNDVNDENRGIMILDPGLGQVRVDWRNFRSLSFHAPQAEAAYHTFSGGGPLFGTVATRDGERFTGTIRWDDDESSAWELLDGETDDADLDVEFGLIRRIERLSSRSAEVTLRDGRAFKLRDSNDVNSDNDGLFITLKDGETVVVDWDDFDWAEFDKP